MIIFFRRSHQSNGLWHVQREHQCRCDDTNVLWHSRLYCTWGWLHYRQRTKPNPIQLSYLLFISTNHTFRLSSTNRMADLWIGGLSAFSYSKCWPDNRRSMARTKMSYSPVNNIIILWHYIIYCNNIYSNHRAQRFVTEVVIERGRLYLQRIYDKITVETSGLWSGRGEGYSWASILQADWLGKDIGQRRTTAVQTESGWCFCNLAGLLFYCIVFVGFSDFVE